MTDRIEHRKLYEQVVDRLELDVRRAELTPGIQLPNERSLGDRFGVSRTVMREAMKTLIEDGLAEVRRGQGTFVVDDTGNAPRRPLRLMNGRVAVSLTDGPGRRETAA